MQRLSRFLVALSGSAAGYNALAESIRLAQWSKGGVTAITVTPSYQGDLSLLGVKDIKSLLTGLSGEILGRAFETAEKLGMRIGVRCEMGEPAEEIAEYAAAGQFDAVVLAASRRPALSRFLRGNPRFEIIRMLDTVEVLIIPEETSIAWGKILLVVDESEVDAGVLARATALARGYDGALNVQRLARRSFRKRVDKRPSEADGREIAIGSETEILRRVQQEDIDMVILHRNLGVGRGLFRSGLVDNIIDQDRAVLILKGTYGVVEATETNRIFMPSVAVTGRDSKNRSS